jgi:hypothetical protein
MADNEKEVSLERKLLQGLIDRAVSEKLNSVVREAGSILESLSDKEKFEASVIIAEMIYFASDSFVTTAKARLYKKFKNKIDLD